MLGTSKDIKSPGLNILPPGVERHVVNGGGLTAFQIFPDDELEIINNEGNQICEIICFNKDGKSDLGILNLKSNNEKNYIRNILSGNDETILATNYQLKKRNLKISNSKSSIIFDLDTEPGEKIKLKSKDKCYAIFSAPGEDMDVTKQNPPTDLTIFVKRAKIVSSFPLRIFLIKFFSLFDLRFNIPRSEFPSFPKQIISHIWFPSLLIISISSSGKIWKPVRPPPLTTCLSTPGGNIFKPGYLISILVPNIFKFYF